MGDESKYLEGEYKGNVIERYKQEVVDRQQAAQIEQEIDERLKQAAENEKERILELCEEMGKEEDELWAAYGTDLYGEYLVQGAILKCNQATLDDFPLSNGEKVIIERGMDGEDEERCQTTLHVWRNPMYINGLTYATVKDTRKNINIVPFRCNCKLEVDRNTELEKIMGDSDRNVKGVCQDLMRLNEEWDNLPIEGKEYLKKHTES